MTQTNVAGSAGYGKFSIDATGALDLHDDSAHTTSSSPATTYTDSFDGARRPTARRMF